MALTPKQALVLAQGYTNTSIEGTTGPLAGKNCTIESQTYANGRNTIVFKWTADNGDVRRTTIVVRDGTPIYEWTSGDNYQYSDLVIYASCFYRCITPNHDTEFDATKWNEIGSPDGNYDLVETKTLLPSIFTSADRKMYFVIDEGLFYLWDGEAWSAQKTKWNDITGKPEFAGVATSGSYNDLSNKPNIPANTSDLTNDSDFVSDANYVHTDNNYDDTAKNIVDGVTSALNDKVDKVENKGLSTNDYTDTDKAIVTGVTDALAGKVDKVQGKGLSTNDYDNTAKGIVDGVTNALNGKVDKNGTDSLMTADEHTKLAGIAAGAEVNVQSDWNQTNQDADDFIKNKPNIPAAQVNADWEASSGVAEILHKPTIPAAQVNSDWEASSGVAEILNKPILGTAAAKNVPSTGNASTTQVVMGNDTRLTDSRPASDVSAWAKESTKPTYTASEVGAIASTEKGSNSGVAELDANGKVPAAQLPGFVDDVIEGYYKAADDRFYEESTFENLITPVSGKSWVDISTNKSYRWTGSVYVRVDEGVQLGETSDTAYRGDRGKTAYEFSQNPATTTPSMDGTGAVGSSGKWAREDHVHPKDTTKADKVSSAISGNVATLDASGNLVDSGKTLGKSVPSDAVFTDTNTKVTQTNTTGSADYRVLLSENANDTTQTVGARKSANLKFNPSTGNLQATQLNGVTIGSSPKFTDTDTKNTAGSTDSSSKLFLIGATSQAANPQTYSHDTAYVGTDGCLYSGGTKVLTSHQSITGKADKVSGAVNGNFAGLDSNGNLKDSGKKASDFATSDAGVPTGGTTGQVLAKASGTNYDTEWVNASGGSGGHTIINSAGTSMTQRAGLQFDGMGVTDDSTNNRTNVKLPTPDYVDTQYNPSTTYSKGMTCISGNVRYRYINSTASSGHQPPNTTYWEVWSVADDLTNLNSGLNHWKSISTSSYGYDYWKIGSIITQIGSNAMQTVWLDFLCRRANACEFVSGSIAFSAMAPDSTGKITKFWVNGYCSRKLVTGEANILFYKKSQYQIDVYIGAPTYCSFNYSIKRTSGNKWVSQDTLVSNGGTVPSDTKITDIITLAESNYLIYSANNYEASL